MRIKILLTGSSGYIASCFNSLYQSKFSIYCLHKKKPKYFNKIKKGKFIECNLLNRKKLKEIFERIRPDLVIHLAAQSTVNEKIKWNDYYENNVKATKNILDIMKMFKIKKLIFSSTASVYKEKKNKILEIDKLKPNSKYGKSKLIAENLIRKYENINHIILRFFNVCSALRKPLIGEFHNPETHLLPVSITKLFNNEIIEIFGKDYKSKDGTCERDYIHIKDVCRAVTNSSMLLFKKSENYTLNIGNGKTISNLEILRSLKKITKKNIKFRFVKKRKGDQPRLFCNTNKAKKIIDWNSKNSNLRKIILDEIFWNMYLQKKGIKRKLLND